MKKTKLIFTLLTASALTAFLYGCGTKKTATAVKEEPLTLMLDYTPNADHVGIYTALKNRNFAKAGINLKIQVPSDPAAPLKLLAAGKVDLAISYEPELLLARDHGLQLTSVGAVVQTPLTSIITLKDDINSPKDLRGKRVGTAGIPYQSAYLETILNKAGVNPKSVKETNVGFNLSQAMLTGKVDATLGAFWNYEAIELNIRHKRPKVIKMETAGVPTYNELIIVAREEDLKRNGTRVRRFMQALSEGYKQTRSNPEKTTNFLVAVYPDLDRKLQLASVEATVSAFFPKNKKNPFGYQSRDEWLSYAQWMKDNGLIKNMPNLNKVVTNEFLPGAALKQVNVNQE